MANLWGLRLKSLHDSSTDCFYHPNHSGALVRRIDVGRLQLALLPPAPEKPQGYHHPQLVAAQRRGSAVHSVE